MAFFLPKPEPLQRAGMANEACYSLDLLKKAYETFCKLLLEKAWIFESVLATAPQILRHSDATAWQWKVKNKRMALKYLILLLIFAVQHFPVLQRA